MPRRLLLLLAAFAVLALTSLAGIATAAQAGVGAQNRVWALQTGERSLVGENGSESSCTHPGLSSGSAGIVAGFCVATEDSGAAADTVVLGHYPEYLQAGGRTFSVPTDVWDAMSPEEQWAANQKFLDRAVARGSDVQLATPADAAREGSFHERELQYLQSKGYTVGPGGTSMVPPGG